MSSDTPPAAEYFTTAKALCAAFCPQLGSIACELRRIDVKLPPKQPPAPAGSDPEDTTVVSLSLVRYEKQEPLDLEEGVRLAASRVMLLQRGRTIARNCIEGPHEASLPVAGQEHTLVFCTSATRDVGTDNLEIVYHTETPNLPDEEIEPDTP